MAEIDVTVNGHKYRVACEDGEEDHLMSIANHLDAHATRLANELGQVGETRMMLMTTGGEEPSNNNLPVKYTVDLRVQRQSRAAAISQTYR